MAANTGKSKKDSHAVSSVPTAGNNYGQQCGSRIIPKLADYSGLSSHLANRHCPKMILGAQGDV